MIGGVKQASVWWVRWVRQVTRGWIEGAVHSMGTLYHTATTTAPPPAQLLPLRRMLCSPWIERSR